MAVTLRQRPVLALGLLLVVVFVCYAPALGNGFTMDDRHAAMGIDPHGMPRLMIYDLEPLGAYFSSHYWHGDHEVDNLFRPVTVLSYALRFRVWGDNAAVAHLANVLLHLGAVVLVYRLLAALACSAMACLVGAGVFGLHAVHSETVVGVVGRAELLAFVFGAGAVLLWCRTTSQGRRSTVSVALTSLLLFLAFCSKEIGVVWVPFLFVFRLARAWQSAVRGIPCSETRRIVLDIALVSLVPLALFLFLRERMLDSLPYLPEPPNFIRNPLAHMDLVARFCMGVQVLGHGLRLCLAPFDLAADYSHRVFALVTEPTQWRFLVAAIVLLLVLAGGLWVRRKHPLLFLAMATFLGFAFVISNIPVVTGTVFGERLYYAPSLGLSFAVAWLWSRLPGWRQVLGVVLGVVLGTWGVLCVTVILERNVVWQDDRTLFRHEVVNQPESVRMQLCAGSTYFEERKIDDALCYIERALELEPEYANAWCLLGAINSDRQQDREAELQLKRALTVRYFDRRPDHRDAHANLGNLYLRQQRLAEAAAHYEQALRLNPKDIDLFDRLEEMSRSGQLSRVGRDLATILRQGKRAAPYSPYWDGYLGLLAFEGGDPAAAAPLLEKAVQGTPRGLFGGKSGITLRMALADCYLATGQPGAAMPLLSELASGEVRKFRPAVAQEAQKRIHAALRR